MESLKKQEKRKRQISLHSDQDTIAAIATPPGAGGVAIIRISGPLSYKVSLILTKRKSLTPRYAHFVGVFNANGLLIDQGVAIYFPGPNSFTGEDVVELQMHGSPILLKKIMEEIFEHNIRQASPGEFSKRAFLNEKIDLAQAEAILDVIHAQSEKAAIAAQNSLQGMFSQKVNIVLESLKHTRVYLEASLDFSEEDIEHETREYISQRLSSLIDSVQMLLSDCGDGCVLSQGIKTAIIGPPNAGKSSFFNALTKDETAIVSKEAGTTRDLIKQTITLDDLLLHLIDTAGIRETDGDIENIGIKRAIKEIDLAELVVLVLPVSDSIEKDIENFLAQINFNTDTKKLMVVVNKMDLWNGAVIESIESAKTYPMVFLSALTGENMSDFSIRLKEIVLDRVDGGESTFSARARHVNALKVTLEHLIVAQQVSHVEELCAEELKSASLALSEITGRYTSDDLLGDVFANFCIGK